MARAMPEAATVTRVVSAFAGPGEVTSVRPHGQGHIHDTFAVAVAGDEAPRYLVQRLNTAVFADADGLMDNVARVTAHLRQKLRARATPDLDRRVLTPLAARAGGHLHRDADGGVWRAFAFIQHTTTFDVLTSTAQAEAVAYAFGAFQRDLADLPGPPLVDTIPHFHDAARRYAAFERAVERDVAHRAHTVPDEIAFARARAAYAHVLPQAQARGELTTRTVHNDAKLGNVLFDARTGEALCVVDLDTVMPGSALYDIGDLVRTGASTAAEDTPSPGTMHLSAPLFEALARGYWTAMRGALTPFEKAHLVFSGMLMAYIMGLRFLTDYLDGDVYYKTARPTHNLDRCRAQFALIRSMESQQTALEAFTARL